MRFSLQSWLHHQVFKLHEKEKTFSVILMQDTEEEQTKQAHSPHLKNKYGVSLRGDEIRALTENVIVPNICRTLYEREVTNCYFTYPWEHRHGKALFFAE